MIYNNVEYLSLPQQVEKNKDDIRQIKIDTKKNIYSNGDTLPDPGDGNANTYLVIVRLAPTGPMDELSIGGEVLIDPSFVVIANISGQFFVSPNPNESLIATDNLLISCDYFELLAL